MRTTFNSSFIISASDLARTAEDLAKRQAEVSSGRRISKSSDDPSASSGSVHEHAEMAALDRYAQTADTANARLSIVDSVLSDMLDQLTSAKTTILNARGTNVTDTQRAALADQLSGLRDALFADYGTSFNGNYLFSGMAATTAPYTKNSSGTVSSYAGTASTMAVDVDRNTAVTVSVNGDSVARGTDTQDIFAALDQAIADIRAGNAAGMAAAGAAVERAFGRATAAQTQIGTSMNAVEIHQGRVADLRRASEGRADGLEKVDMAEAITKMSQADTAYRAALGAIGNTGRKTLMDYL
jgi:flagellar hook-associated protein 3 FlgL